MIFAYKSMSVVFLVNASAVSARLILIERRVKAQPFLKEFLSWHHDRLVALLPVLIALARRSLYNHFTLNMLVSMVSCKLSASAHGKACLHNGCNSTCCSALVRQ